jgi:predicted aspartyl protease
MSDLGTFRTTIAIENLYELGRVRELPDTLVDTASEFTWVPRIVLEDLGIEAKGSKRFRLADGSVIVREFGWAIVHAAGEAITDPVIFAETTDITLLGAHTLEGLNLKIDVVSKQLVDAGPIITAAAGVRVAGALRLKPVAHLPYGQDVPRLRGIVLEPPA